MKKHGMSGTPIYQAWAEMLRRCTNPKSHAWADYGGRGVKVCERWKSFENFHSDMGDRPLGTTLDRYPDNDGNYEPGNCRWATLTQQGRNKRNNVRYQAFGESKTFTEWSEDGRCSVGAVTLKWRFYRGWDTERAITAPARGNGQPTKHALHKDCSVCGTTFTPHPTKRERQKTCSPVCAQELRSRSRRARLAEERASKAEEKVRVLMEAIGGRVPA